LLVRAALHQQWNEFLDSAAPELRISVPHDSGYVIERKTSVFVGESTLHPIDELPLFLRHPDIVAANQTPVKIFRPRNVLEIVG